MSRPRLSALPPLVLTVAPRVGYQPGNRKAESAYRQATQPVHTLYKSAEWKRLRWQVLTEHAWTCAHCGRVCANRGEAIVDHIKAHKGDLRLFWDRRNLQVLCKEHHDSWKQRQERGPGGI